MLLFDIGEPKILVYENHIRRSADVKSEFYLLFLLLFWRVLKIAAVKIAVEMIE